MRRLFGVVAPRYDLITRLFSYGMDRYWKRELLASMALKPHAIVLDLACGTADFSRMLPHQQCIACDLTPRMLRLAQSLGTSLTVCADAMRLPFSDQTFDAVLIGYGLRNFPDLRESLLEIRRVLRPGGLLGSLDFYLPANPLWRLFYLGYLYAQGWLWGTLLHGEAHIYTYIPESIRSFVTVREMTSQMKASGFAQVRQRSFVGGGIGLHLAVRL